MTDFLLNRFALYSFRDIADGDYIAARMAYRADLIIQAFTASQQALEKYIKAILLFRRIPQTTPEHSLRKLLAKLEKKDRLDLSDRARTFITFIDEWDFDRYFTYAYSTNGDELIQLDEAVWELRRYCTPVFRSWTQKAAALHESDLRRIESARDKAPQLFRQPAPGYIEQVLRTKGQAYEDLIWKNLYFGKSNRTSVTHAQKSTSHNSPLALSPEMIDKLAGFICLPGHRRPPRQG